MYSWGRQMVFFAKRVLNQSRSTRSCQFLYEYMFFYCRVKNKVMYKLRADKRNWTSCSVRMKVLNMVVCVSCLSASWKAGAGSGKMSAEIHAVASVVRLKHRDQLACHLVCADFWLISWSLGFTAFQLRLKSCRVNVKRSRKWFCSVFSLSLGMSQKSM